jgi:hypothetical protein
MRSILGLFLVFALTCISYAQSVPKLSLRDSHSKLRNSGNNSEFSAKGKDFSFTINPYIWGMAVGGTVSLPNIPSGYPQTYEFNKSFSDAVSNLKFAFMAGGRLKYKQVSLLYDIVYTNLKNFGATIPSSQQLTSANITFKEFITDLSIAYRINTGSKTTTLDVYAGARFWAVDLETTIIPPNQPQVMLSGSKSWVDPLIGVQANFTLSKEWYSYVRSDFGGFGANSNWSFMMVGGFGYKFNPNWNTSLGLKYLGVDYEKEKFLFKVNQYGLLLSLGYWY